MSGRPTSAPRRPVRLGVAPPASDDPPRARLLVGSAPRTLDGLKDEVAQAIVTSPPYWGLRDYGVPPTVWGGRHECRHVWVRDQGRVCRRCSAWKGCLGQEASPDLYVSHLVEVLREARRCLRADGTLWLVLGDTFASAAQAKAGAFPGDEAAATQLKYKDLVGIPWRVALALQADGWWLRSDNIWAKPNAMPESVFDRPTRAHEYVFLLSRSPRYLYDWYAVREPDKGGRSGNGFVRPERLSYGGGEKPRGASREWIGGGGRNRRTVWELPTQCFPGAHFATFPERLVEVCVLAGTAPVSCRRCGTPWRRVVESFRLLDGRSEVSGGETTGRSRPSSGRSPLATGYGTRRVEIRRRTAGWDPGCEHDDPGGRSTVLDPFAGAGTTGLVAARLGRDFVGIELSAEYAEMARRRLDEAGAPVERDARGA